MDRISILQKYLRLVLSESGHGTWGLEMDAELAKLKPPREKKPDPVSFNRETGRWEGISPELMEKWSSLFHGVNLDGELRKAAVWLLGHPDRRKVLYSAFLTRWLNKACLDLERRTFPTRGGETAEERAERRAREAGLEQ